MEKKKISYKPPEKCDFSNQVYPSPKEKLLVKYWQRFTSHEDVCNTKVISLGEKKKNLEQIHEE